MSIFHDEEDGNPEPVAGLPENLPANETIQWQGKPNAITLAVHAFHIRFVAVYFALFTIWRIAAIAAREGTSAEMFSVLSTSLLGVIAGISILVVLAWLMARSTIYTITDKRLILRYGVAIRKYVNIPFAIVTAANLKRHALKSGSIALSIADHSSIGYLHLWPHVRPLHYKSPEPMLRALPDANHVTQVLCNAMKRKSPTTVSLHLEPKRTAHNMPLPASINTKARATV